MIEGEEDGMVLDKQRRGRGLVGDRDNFLDCGVDGMTLHRYRYLYAYLQAFSRRCVTRREMRSDHVGKNKLYRSLSAFDSPVPAAKIVYSFGLPI